MTLKIKDNYRFWFKFSLIYFFIQTVVRVIFILDRPPGLLDLIDTLLDGMLWDAGTWILISIPFMLVSITLPVKWHKSLFDSPFNHVLTFTVSFILLGIGLCEIIFWNEFHSRFNFIAVDYLIYTNEVLSNLRESYPMGKILLGLVGVTLVVTYGSSSIKISSWDRASFFKRSTTFVLFGVILPVVFVFGLGPWLENHDEDFHDDQLARNGALEFFRAFRSNRIDYNAFYPTLTLDRAQGIYDKTKVPLGPIPFDFINKRPNVVMIVVESLGAKFIGPLSKNKNTTPYLNKLSEESIFFKNFYATGTRTVRGLEAINLSVPPTPGYAVVKRPDNKGLYSLGHSFARNGYDPIFLYGGRGFFDNMNSFFSGNGFHVIDQGDFKKNEVTFSNAWGVCDEDLFNKAHQTILEHDKTKPFLLFLLTTTNHRPFTYPNGKIDIASGLSRKGAVKYTDFAIGKFLEKVKDETWAKNTIFVVVADHSTEGRGRFDLEMKDFHIPLWIYAPGILQPRVITKLGSQIDLTPTLIHLLGLKDDSPFYGRSFFNPNWTEERALIGNYQYVGFYKNRVLTTLGPNRMVRNYSFDPETSKQGRIDQSPFLDEAISYYQTASHLLDKGLYKHP